MLFLLYRGEYNGSRWGSGPRVSEGRESDGEHYVCCEVRVNREVRSGSVFASYLAKEGPLLLLL